ncbi:MAG: acyltransferase [bacterium]
MRELAKRVLRGAARLAALPEYGLYRVKRLFLDPDRALHGSSQAISLLPGVAGEYVRREFHRLALEACSDDCCLSFGVVFSKRGARVGRRVYVGGGCTIGLATLEDDALLASNVDVLSGAGQHRFDDGDVPIREQGGAFARVTVVADSWIGNRAVVMADVGRGSVVGAGSVVTKPLPERSIAVGTPARVVGTRGEARDMARTGA